MVNIPKRRVYFITCVVIKLYTQKNTTQCRVLRHIDLLGRLFYAIVYKHINFKPYIPSNEYTKSIIVFGYLGGENHYVLLVL